MENIQRTYLPAAGKNWTLPLYDPLVKLLGLERIRRTFLDQASLRAKHRVLDIGCGTGTLALLIKRLCPEVEVVGLDPDPGALARAKRKTARANVAIRFDQGYSDDLPHPEASFDRVFSSFMFHHVWTEQRKKMLQEVQRVLATGGSLHLVDFSRQEKRTTGWRSHLIPSDKLLKDNHESRILGLMRKAGFVGPQKVKDGAIMLGSLGIAYYRASVSNS